ncbi:MAG: S1 RNA-binding domain-containing protein, partial [Bacteroidales bacterium]|nr:S1 RNA-binding domain-containing protein [Bacteroidales bacterium]
VRNFTTFGIFVELEEGVDGLIHISDLSWSKKIKHPAEFTKVGEKINVIVLEVDAETRRLSLGHKQLEENPWDVFESIFTLNSIHKGTIMNMSDKGGATIALPYGVEAFCPKSQLMKEDKTPINIDDQMDFKITEFSKDSKKIIVSHSKTWQTEEAKTDDKKGGNSEEKAIRKINDQLERTTLGDLDALANLRDEMEKNEQ